MNARNGVITATLRASRRIHGATCFNSAVALTRRQYRSNNLSDTLTTQTSKGRNVSKAISQITSSADFSTIVPGSQNHSCLNTFLAHAARTNLSPSSTLYVGTQYEYLVARCLSRLGFRLVRVGRSNDAGIDLLGEWTVPSHPSPIRVLLQCKRHTRRLVPEFVRELEGAFAGAPAGWRGEGVIGFLVSPRSASKGVRDALGRSSLPIGFISVDDEDSSLPDKRDVSANSANPVYDQGIIRQFLWNWKAQQFGLEGMGVNWRYTQADSTSDPDTSKEVALTWNGLPIDRLGSPLPSDTNLTSVLGQIIEPKPSSAMQNLDALLSQGRELEQSPPKKRGRPKKFKES